MKTSDFDYELPPEFIAQTPVEPRDSSRLLVLDRKTGALEHAVFHDIGKYLHPGDLLVLNQTRVIPARLFAHKSTGGKVEVLLLRRESLLIWEVLVGGKGMLAGRHLQIEDGPAGVILEVLEGARRRLLFDKPVEPYFPKIGHVPLPPYIHEKLADPERYQTVYARQLGSAAAPTAGLHFTPQLLEQLQAQGVALGYVTLHVGLDTFAPVTEEDAEQHAIHTEWCELPAVTAQLINQARRQRGRIIAVGTTSVRTLESAARNAGMKEHRGEIQPFTGDTDLYITPGYEFQLVDGMVTNFHLPKSTLIMLVSAFAGREAVLHAYDVAKQEHYRFYSFGDAMLIV